MKVTKREFVKGVAAVAVAAGCSASSAARSSSPAPSFDIVVYNNWFPQAREFASRFPTARALAVEGDAGQLWYGTLRGLVNSGFRRIAGLTTHTDLLILETLALDGGLKVRSRNDAGRLVSWVLI